MGCAAVRCSREAELQRRLEVLPRRPRGVAAGFRIRRLLLGIRQHSPHPETHLSAPGWFEVRWLPEDLPPPGGLVPKTLPRECRLRFQNLPGVRGLSPGD